MRFAEVVISEIERNRSFKVFLLFAEGVREAGEASAVHAQRVVLLFDMGRANALRIGRAHNDVLFRFHNFSRAIAAGGIFVGFVTEYVFEIWP